MKIQAQGRSRQGETTSHDRISPGKEPGLRPARGSHPAMAVSPAEDPVPPPVETKARFFYPRDLVMPEDPEPARVEPSWPAVKVEVRKSRKINPLSADDHHGPFRERP